MLTGRRLGGDVLRVNNADFLSFTRKCLVFSGLYFLLLYAEIFFAGCLTPTFDVGTHFCLAPGLLFCLFLLADRRGIFFIATAYFAASLSHIGLFDFPPESIFLSFFFFFSTLLLSHFTRRHVFGHFVSASLRDTLILLLSLVGLFALIVELAHAPRLDQSFFTFEKNILAVFSLLLSCLSFPPFILYKLSRSKYRPEAEQIDSFSRMVLFPLLFSGGLTLFLVLTGSFLEFLYPFLWTRYLFVLVALYLLVFYHVPQLLAFLIFTPILLLLEDGSGLASLYETRVFALVYCGCFLVVLYHQMKEKKQHNLLHLFLSGHQNEAEKALVGFWEWRPEEQYFVLSEEARILMGLRPDQSYIPLKEFLRILEREDRRFFVESFKAGLSGQRICSFRSNPHFFLFIEWWGGPYLSEDKGRFFDGIIADISHLHRIEMAKKTSDRRFQLLLDSNNDSVMLLMPDGRVELANKKAHERHDDLEKGNRRLADLYPDELHESFDCWLEQAVEKREEIRVAYAVDNHWEDICLYPIIDPQEDFVSRVAFQSRDVTDYRLIVEELKKTADDLRASEELTKLGHWTWGRETRCFSFSSGMRRLFAVSDSEEKIEDNVFLKNMRSEDHVAFEKAFDALISDGKAMDISCRYHFPAQGGMEMIIHIQGERKTDVLPGEPAYFGTAFDVTAIRQAEEAIRENEAKLQAVLNVADAAIFMMDGTGHILLANKEMRKRFEIKGRVQGAHIRRLIPDGVAEEFLSRAEKVIEKRRLLRFDMMVQDRWYRTEIIPVQQNNEVQGVAVYSRDITEERLAEESLFESEERLALALSGASEGLWDWSIPDGAVFYSPRWKEMLGYADHEISENYEEWRSRIHPDDSATLVAALEEHMQGDTPDLRVSFRMRHRDGGFRWMLVRGKAIRNAAGELVRMSGTQTDITEQKIAEAALEKAKEEAERANKAKSRFLAAASHDLRQPLQALRMFIDALQNVDLTDRAQMLTEKVSQSSEALATLLNNFLDISKIDAGGITPKTDLFSLEGLLAPLIDEFRPTAEAKGIGLSYAPTSLAVRSDPVLVERILRNLISNAIRYTNEGRVLIGCRLQGQKVQVGVYDTGIGVPKHQQALITEAFYQVDNPARDRREGVGLGLSIVEGLVRLLQTKIELVSEEGRGSVFSFRLPFAGRITKDQKRDKKKKHKERRRLDALVVVVDDDEDILQGVRLCFETIGCRVLAFSSGQDALKDLEPNLVPDLIFADYRLGESLTGLGVIQALRDIYKKEVPGIVLTGEADAEVERLIFKEKMRLLHKPISASSLQETAFAILDKH